VRSADNNASVKIKSAGEVGDTGCGDDPGRFAYRTLAACAGMKSRFDGCTGLTGIAAGQKSRIASNLPAKLAGERCTDDSNRFVIEWEFTGEASNTVRSKKLFPIRVDCLRRKRLFIQYETLCDKPHQP